MYWASWYFIWNCIIRLSHSFVILIKMVKQIYCSITARHNQIIQITSTNHSPVKHNFIYLFLPKTENPSGTSTHLNPAISDQLIGNQYDILAPNHPLENEPTLPLTVF